MAKTITLRFAARCADKSCGAELPVGARARWYGRGRVYGLECHEQRPTNGRARRNGSAGYRASVADPTGFYAEDGTLIGRTNPRGRCEDAPCCGCCS